MSASASKKKRKVLEDQGLSAKNVASQKAHEKKSQTVKSVMLVVLAMLVCFAAVFAVIKLVNKPSYDTDAAAVTVGTEKVTVPVYNYLYSTLSANYFSANLIQGGVSFSQQTSMLGGGTVEEFMKQTTNSTLKEVLNVVAKAKADNYQLTEDDKAYIESGLTAVKNEATQFSFSDVDKYLKARYGEGCDRDSYKDYLTLTTIYSSYASKLSETFKPTAEDLQKAYDEDHTVYDLVTVTYMTVAAESSQAAPTGTLTPDGSGTTANTTTPTIYTDEAKADAKEKADSYVKEMPEDASTRTLTKSNATGIFTEEIVNWLYDDARKEGDVEAFAGNEEKTKYFTVRFDGRDDNNYCLVNANILKINKDKEGETVKEGEKTAVQKRDDLLAAIKDGMTDEEFKQALSAQGLSSEANSYTRTYEVAEVRDFLFDSSRKAGDLLTTYESDTAYYVVRYVSTEEETYRNQMIRNNLWSKYYSDISSANELVVDEEMMKHAFTDLTFNSNSSNS